MLFDIGLGWNRGLVYLCSLPLTLDYGHGVMGMLLIVVLLLLLPLPLLLLLLPLYHLLGSGSRVNT